MRKAVQMYYDDEKDKELIEWLGTKTNRSAYMRIAMYEKMQEDKTGLIKKIEKREDPEAIVNNSFKKSLSSFIKK